MVIFLKKVLVVCCLIFFQASYAEVQDNYSCDKAKQIIFNFVDTKESNDWSIAEGNAKKFQNCSCEMAPILYYIYRMKVVLPNSMALKGISPNDYILSQKLKVNDQVNILKSCRKEVYLPLIHSMMNQSFDSAVSTTAIDLKNKLSS